MNTQENNKLKAIIFDFDETLYYSPNALNCYIKFIQKTITDLSHHTADEAYKLMEKNGFTQVGENRISFGQNCEKFDITKVQWNEYKKNHFFEIDYENCKIVDNDLLSKISNNYKLFIVSNELYENIEIKAQKLHINLKNFTNVFAPNKTNNLSINKKDIYMKILNTYQISTSEAIVLGDRYNVDIKPFEELGGTGITIKNTEQIENFLTKLL